MTWPAFTEYKQAELRRLYVAGTKVATIAKHFGVSKYCVGHWAKKLGLSRLGTCRDCGAVVGKTRQKCDACRDAAERRAHTIPVYQSDLRGGSSQEIPGHEERMFLLTARASLEMPLGGKDMARSEVTVTVDGVRLTDAQVMTLRVACEAWSMDLKPGSLGDDDHARAMEEAYRSRLDEIRRLLAGGST